MKKSEKAKAGAPGPNPGRLMELSRGFWQSQILFTGNELGIFDALAAGGKTPAEVARKLKLDGRGADILMHALASMELLEKREGRFYLAPIAERHLVAGRPGYMGNILAHASNLMKTWAHLPETVRTGKPAPRPLARDSKEGQQALRNFILGMSDLAEPLARTLASRLDLSQARRALDVGGGPGTYAFAFARANPKMECAVFDLPSVIPITLEQIEKHGMKTRVGTIQGDMFVDGFGDGFDVVLMSNVLHMAGAAECRALLKKGFRALNPKGRLVVVEFPLDADRTGPPTGAMFSVNMLVGTPKGASWPYVEIAKWMCDAGCAAVEMIDLSPQSVALVGHKPAAKKKSAAAKPAKTPVKKPAKKPGRK